MILKNIETVNGQGKEGLGRRGGGRIRARKGRRERKRRSCGCVVIVLGVIEVAEEIVPSGERPTVVKSLFLLYVKYTSDLL